MAHFSIHQDPIHSIENIKPKAYQKTKNLVKKQRNVLQPLSNYQQNSKIPKLDLKENVTNENKKETQIETGDLIKLKPMFKKNNITTRSYYENREYEEDILKYLIYLENKITYVKPFYMTKQIHLNWEMRTVLIDWLVSVADEYKMNESTIHLGVNYLDRFLSNISVIREKFQLVGATAMMIAGKVEEIYPPDMKEWSYLTGDAFTIRQFIKMEQLMLRVLNFEMNSPTMLDFIKHFCTKLKLDSKTMNLAMYLSELILLEGDSYLQHYPSKLASGALLLARHTLCKEPWSKKLEETSGYTLKQLSPVVQQQHKTFKSSPFRDQQAVQKKYASEKFLKVALLKPRVLILDEEEE